MAQRQSALTHHAVYGVGEWLLACWNCWFESRQVHESLSVVSGVSYHVVVSVLG